MGGWRTYWLAAMLALAMVLGPTLGQMHKAVHAAATAPALSYGGIGHIAHASASEAPACAGPAADCVSGSWIHALFAGHGPADCQLLDQASHGYAGPPAVAQFAAAAPDPAQPFIALSRPRAIFVAASFDARAPPASPFLKA